MTLVIGAVIGTACAEKSTAPAPAEQLKERLAASVEAGVVLFGHQDDLFYGKNWNRWEAGEERSDVRAVAGDYPAVLGVELGCLELGQELSIDNVPFAMIREGIREHHRRGGIAAISWHAANPATDGDSWDVAEAQGVVSTALEGGANHAKMMMWLERVADFLDSLRDDEGRLIPVVWRPWHEMSGNWFWWGAPFCSPDEYRALWHMTYDYMVRERGLDNLVWAVSPGFSNRAKNGYTDYYPGDEEVDLIGIDTYQYGTSAQFAEQLRSQLEQLAALAAEHGKLLALTETGSEALPDTQWWTRTLLPAIEGLPVAYVLTWRNAWDKPAHYYAPFEGEASADDFRQFAARERIGMLGDLVRMEQK